MAGGPHGPDGLRGLREGADGLRDADKLMVPRCAVGIRFVDTHMNAQMVVKAGGWFDDGSCDCSMMSRMDGLQNSGLDLVMVQTRGQT